MTKLAGLLIAVAAFAVALYLVARRRGAPRSRGRFALLVAGFVALLGGCRSQETPTSAPKSAPKSTPRAEAQPVAPAEPVAARAALAAIRARWLGVPKLEQANYDQIKQVVAARQAECAKELSGLVKAKTISARGAEAFTTIYGDRVFHQLRQRSASCYDPTTLGLKVQMTRSALEKRLKLLTGLRAAGALKPAVQQKVERGLKRQMELLLRAKALWDKQAVAKKPDWDKLRAEEQAILALYAGQQESDVAIKDTIKVRPGLEEAVGLIARLYN